MNETEIEFEIEETNAPYGHVRKLVKKICEDHEGKRSLHIKVKLKNAYLEEDLSEDTAS